MGVVEIAAGLLVAVAPRIGGYVVAAWLAGIIVNLLLGEFYDVALRDVGLLLGALALARLANASTRTARRGHDLGRRAAEEFRAVGTSISGPGGGDTSAYGRRPAPRTPNEGAGND